VAILGVGCAATAGPRTPPAHGNGEACAADGLGPLLHDRGKMGAPECASGPACGAACLRGDGVACYVRGVELQQQNGPPDVAADMYLRACQSGIPIGCTNYAAGLWAHDDSRSPCAKRLFEKACAADEAFGCGMLGRMIVDAATPADAEQLRQGREILDRSCQKLGRFPCRALALEIEHGRFGPPDAAAVTALLARACATGDPDACGAPPNADSTFNAQ